VGVEKQAARRRCSAAAAAAAAAARHAASPLRQQHVALPRAVHRVGSWTDRRRSTSITLVHPEQQPAAATMLCSASRSRCDAR
jgi:hypothetical protein